MWCLTCNCGDDNPGEKLGKAADLSTGLCGEFSGRQKKETPRAVPSVELLATAFVLLQELLQKWQGEAESLPRP